MMVWCLEWVNSHFSWVKETKYSSIPVGNGIHMKERGKNLSLQQDKVFGASINQPCPSKRVLASLLLLYEKRHIHFQPFPCKCLNFSANTLIPMLKCGDQHCSTRQFKIPYSQTVICFFQIEIQLSSNYCLNIWDLLFLASRHFPQSKSRHHHPYNTGRSDISFSWMTVVTISVQDSKSEYW